MPLEWFCSKEPIKIPLLWFWVLAGGQVRGVWGGRAPPACSGGVRMGPGGRGSPPGTVYMYISVARIVVVVVVARGPTSMQIALFLNCLTKQMRLLMLGQAVRDRPAGTAHIQCRSCYKDTQIKTKDPWMEIHDARDLIIRPVVSPRVTTSSKNIMAFYRGRFFPRTKHDGFGYVFCRFLHQLQFVQ